MLSFARQVAMTMVRITDRQTDRQTDRDRDRQTVRII